MRWAVILIALFVSGFSPLGGAPQDPPPPALTPEPAAALDGAFSPSDAFQRVQLAPMPGFDDDAAYLRSVGDRVDELVKSAEGAAGAGNETRRVGFLLAAVNVILAHQLEPSCTRAVLRLPRDQNQLDLATVQGGLDRADTLLARAQRTLQSVRESEGADVEWLREAAHRVKTLRAFGSALGAFLASGSADVDERGVRRAASLLSPLLEDRRRGVAAAATFWQASLRSLDADPARALSVLDLALADPHTAPIHYALFARLLRCRIIADRGGAAAALALLMQLEERIDEWITDETRRDLAVRTAQLVRLQILTAWRERLSPTDAVDERRWCADRFRALATDRFGEERNHVLRLTPAVPIIAEPPDPPSESNEDAPKDTPKDAGD